MQDDEDAIASITHVSDILLWGIENGNMFQKYNRHILSKTIKVIIRSIVYS